MFLMTIELISDDGHDKRAKQCVVGLTQADRKILEEQRTLGIPLDMVPKDAHNIILVPGETQADVAEQLGIDLEDRTGDNPTAH